MKEKLDAINKMISEAGEIINNELLKTPTESKNYNTEYINLSEQMQYLVSHYSELLLIGFMRCAANGYEFVPIEEVNTRFRKTIEENYKSAQPSTSFIKFAKSYWTLERLCHDTKYLSPTTIADILLNKLELDIAGLFFPSGGNEIDVDHRENVQRNVLSQSGANIDIEDFINGNPYLKRFRQRQANNGCFIATATYGDYNAEQVLFFRRFRDQILSKSFVGIITIKFYYIISPYIAKRIVKSNLLKEISTHLLNTLKTLIEFTTNLNKS